MSLGLVSNYADSDQSDEDSNEEELFVRTSQPIRNQLELEDNEEEKPESQDTSSQKSIFFGVNDDDYESDDDNINEDEIQVREKNSQSSVSDDATETRKRKLPCAAALLNAKRYGLSVFQSEAQREESAHNAILSQHVALSEAKSDGKKMKHPCKAFLRGECKRGDRCRFAHPIKQNPTVSTSQSISRRAEMYKSVSDVNNVFNNKPM